MNVRTMYLLTVIGLASVGATQIPAQSGGGQPRMITRQFQAGDDMFILPELGAVIIEDSSGISVAAMPPAGHAPRAYEGVDLKEQDRIVMLNGKKLAKVADLRDFYEKAAIGDTIKFGIKRGDQMRLVSFAKADPASLPKRQIKMVKDGEAQPEASGSAAGGWTTAAKGEAIAVPELALVLMGGEEGVRVEATLGSSKELYPDGGPESGDRILKLNGQEVTSTADFDQKFAAIAVGGAVKLEYERNGKPLVVAVEKKAAPKMHMQMKPEKK